MRRLAVILTLTILQTQAARADDPSGTDTPPPATAPAPTPDAPAPPGATTPAPPGAIPRQTPPAPLRPSPGPLADPTPRAYPPLDAVGAREHDGLLVRILMGAATTSASADSHSLSGGGLGLGFALGYAVRPNLILHFDWGMSSATEPDESVDGSPVNRDVSIYNQGLGPGATYYFAHNIFATGAIHATWLSRVETRFVPPDGPFGSPEEMQFRQGTNAGIGASAAIGKEWWITASWGLGLAARLQLGTMRDATPESTTWRTYNLSLLATATMN